MIPRQRRNIPSLREVYTSNQKHHEALLHRRQHSPPPQRQLPRVKTLLRPNPQTSSEGPLSGKCQTVHLLTFPLRQQDCPFQAQTATHHVQEQLQTRLVPPILHRHAAKLLSQFQAMGNTADQQLMVQIQSSLNGAHHVIFWPA